MTVAVAALKKFRRLNDEPSDTAEILLGLLSSVRTEKADTNGTVRRKEDASFIFTTIKQCQ